MAANFNNLPPLIFAVDTETTGVSYSSNLAEGFQVVSIGALVVSTKDWSIVDAMYIEVKHDPKYKWNETAEQVHGLTQAYLEANGITLEAAAAELLNFIAKWFGLGNRVTVLGHRVAFDLQFLNELFATIGCEVIWERLTIDSASMGAALLGISGSDALFDALGLPARTNHNSLEDITYTLEAVKVMRSYFIKGIEAAACDTLNT